MRCGTQGSLERWGAGNPDHDDDYDRPRGDEDDGDDEDEDDDDHDDLYHSFYVNLFEG